MSKIVTNPNDGQHEIMAVRRQSWGRGVDAKAAKKQLNLNDSRPGHIRYWVVPKGATIDPMGDSIDWSLNDHPDGKCERCAF